MVEYEMGKATIEYIERMQRRMHIEDECIVLTISDEYNIPLNKCNSYTDILAWAFHLTEKTWIEKEDIRYFIQLACHENKIDLPTV